MRSTITTLLIKPTHTAISIFLLLLAFGIQSSVKAQVYGKVTDENEEGLPFATLYVKGTSIGTTTNAEGNYQLELKPGSYQLVFQFVGYKKTEKVIEVNEKPLSLNVSLQPEIIKLNEIVVNASDEDPAYAIIRNAIAKRKFYQKEVDAFDADVYIKGLQRLDERPEKVFGFNVTIDTGIVYLSESVSKLSFKQPDKIKETMISSKVSGNNNAFSFNQASEMMFSFYENLIEVEGISERGFVSPIANNAMLFYRFQLIGTFQEGDQLVNKIKVTPIRKNDPAFSGFIYINEDSWRIHSTDLLLTKANQIEFVDSLKISQVYAPVEDKTWMLFSQQFNFQFKAFGFKGSGYFISIHSNYKIEQEYEKKYFTNEIMAIQKEANKRDSIYWKKIRPIPLTSNEVEDYFVKDSLSVIKESKQYKDSIDQKSNKFTFTSLVLGGYTYSNTYKKQYFTINPVLNMFQFNTVEGFVMNMNLDYTKTYKDFRYFSISPELRYGFSSNDLYYQLKGRYQYKPKKFSRINFAIGKTISQFNSNNPISPFINSLVTLIQEKNYMKLYEKSFFEIGHRTELVNGILLTSSIKYEDRKALFNTSDYSFKNDEENSFTPNAPVNSIVDNTSFPDHQVLVLDLNFRFRFAQKYISRPNRKVNLGSKYPTLYLNYSKAFKDILGSDISFDKINVSIRDDLNFGLVGTASYQINAGAFLSNDSLAFPDFIHFSGNRTNLSNFELGNFQLLDYYQYSTNDEYLSLHYEHHFNGFIFNKFPLLRKTRIQAVSTLNYLKTSELKNYLELGLGIEHIFKVLRVDYFIGFESGNNVQNGIRLGVGF